VDACATRPYHDCGTAIRPELQLSDVEICDGRFPRLNLSFRLVIWDSPRPGIGRQAFAQPSSSIEKTPRKKTIPAKYQLRVCPKAQKRDRRHSTPRPLPHLSRH
jgi:hypothetical protein